MSQDRHDGQHLKVLIMYVYFVCIYIYMIMYIYIYTLKYYVHNLFWPCIAQGCGKTQRRTLELALEALDVRNAHGRSGQRGQRHDKPWAQEPI